MIRYLFFAIPLAFCLFVPVSAQQKPAPKAAPKAPSSRAAKAPPHVASGADEQDLVDLEKHLLDYIRSKDAKDVEPWLADDFQYTDAHGNSYTREQFLERVKSIPENIDWLSADDMRVRVYGNVAVVTAVKQLRTSTGDVDIVAKPSSPPPVERSRAVTDVFRRLGSDWSLVQEFEADLPSKDAPVTAAPPPPSDEPQQPAPKRDVDSPPKIARPQPPSER
jgi:Domain of unknown function (DUF4440)